MSNHRASAKQRHPRREAITSGVLSAQSGQVSVLRAWATFFRQVEDTFARSAESCVEEDVGGGGGGGGPRRLAETRGECAESMSITDRVCFGVSYSMSDLAVERRRPQKQ